MKQMIRILETPFKWSFADKQLLYDTDKYMYMNKLLEYFVHVLDMQFY
jgi:hypothetical protein